MSLVSDQYVLTLPKDLFMDSGKLQLVIYTILLCLIDQLVKIMGRFKGLMLNGLRTTCPFTSTIIIQVRSK